jgi:hypothetical protein
MSVREKTLDEGEDRPIERKGLLGLTITLASGLLAFIGWIIWAAFLG